MDKILIGIPKKYHSECHILNDANVDPFAILIHLFEKYGYSVVDLEEEEPEVNTNENSEAVSQSQ